MWRPTPVFLPGESHGQRSLAGCSPWGHKGSDTTAANRACTHGDTEARKEQLGTAQPGPAGSSQKPVILPHFRSHLHQHAGTQAPSLRLPEQMQSSSDLIFSDAALRVPVPESEHPASNLSSQVSSLFHVLILTNPSMATALNI